MDCIIIIVNKSVFMYFKVAKKLDLQCSHHRKEIIIYDVKDVLSKTLVMIILQYINEYNHD